jgi:hypothetical protein
MLAHHPFQLQHPSWIPLLKEILHSCCHSPGSQKALGLGFILLAACSRTYSARDGCQGFRCG